MLTLFVIMCLVSTDIVDVFGFVSEMADAKYAKKRNTTAENRANFILDCDLTET